ncbi:hypothetical protein KIM372_14850 [Bombiscardovia nodaiensis]|uniref:Oxygen sensor histidine kinase NreB n=1 Tax=Bombiscardovia nodaiensis TaxID=2932181 RepID=A0ABM8B9T2_9BIFI|nr:hypothetical protein KIM372_14850 [Bombiscardovia nodaiensis]
MGQMGKEAADWRSGSFRTLTQRRKVHVTWNWYFLIELACVLVVSFAFSAAPLANRCLAALLIALPCGFYLSSILNRVYARPGAANMEQVSKTGARGWCFAGIALACTLAATWLNHIAILAQIFVIPQLFIAFAYLPALAIVTALNAGFGLMAFVGLRIFGLDLPSSLMLFAVTVVFSALIGKSFDVLAITNARNQQLLDQLERQQEMIKELSRQEGAAAERERVAREMHDTIAQSLASILALSRAARAEVSDDMLQATRHLTMISELSQTSLDDTRRMIAGSEPADLDGKDLLTALNRSLERATRESSIAVERDLLSQLPPLERRQEVALLRITQEAVTNVVHHAHASQVRLVLQVEGPQAHARLLLTIQDNGQGFDPGRVLDQRRQGQQAGHGYGLQDMHKRAYETGGQLSIESAPGEGTTITAVFPLGSAPADGLTSARGGAISPVVQDRQEKQEKKRRQQ